MLGKFIAIEGIDGVGKATQTKLLSEALSVSGKECLTLEFPNYKKSVFGKLLGECLAGERIDFVNMDARLASLPYMIDRYESAQMIREALARGVYVVSDRFSASNQIHQGGKMQDDASRVELLDWLDFAEHGILGNPQPDVIVYLSAPVEVSLKLLEQKRTAKSNSVKDGVKDTVESDLNYLHNSHDMAQWLAKKYKGLWHMVDCTDGAGSMRSREDIHQDVLGIVNALG